MQIYTVYLYTETVKMNAEVIELTTTNGEMMDQEINSMLNATG